MNLEFEEKALLLRAESAKWLFSIQAGICAVMWQPMDESLDTFPLIGLLLTIAWLGFALSSLASVFVMLALPQATEAMPDAARYPAAKQRLQMLLWLQLACFLGGAGGVCLAALVKSASGLLF